MACFCLLNADCRMATRVSFVINLYCVCVYPPQETTASQEALMAVLGAGLFLLRLWILMTPMMQVSCSMCLMVIQTVSGVLVTTPADSSCCQALLMAQSSSGHPPLQLHL